MESKYAGQAGFAPKTDYAVTAGSAPTGPKKPKSKGPDEDKMNTQSADAPPPNANIVAALTTVGPYAMRSFELDKDDKLLNALILKDDYEGIFEKVPSTQELRSAFRDTANKDKLISKMVQEERISSSHTKKAPNKIGRVSGKSPSSRFGYTPIGNGIGNRGKRFTP